MKSVAVGRDGKIASPSARGVSFPGPLVALASTIELRVDPEVVP